MFGTSCIDIHVVVMNYHTFINDLYIFRCRLRPEGLTLKQMQS